VVSVLDSGAEEPGFKLQPRRCRVTVLGKLFTSIVPLFTKKRNWFVTHVTCRLTAKNRDQLRNPTLGNRVWASFTFFFTMLEVEPTSQRIHTSETGGAYRFAAIGAIVSNASF